jgi:hypothetical protein
MNKCHLIHFKADKYEVLYQALEITESIKDRKIQERFEKKYFNARINFHQSLAKIKLNLVLEN